MDNKALRIIELFLTIPILLLNFLSFTLDGDRILVFVFGILYCLILITQLIFSIIKMVRIEIPFGIIVTIILIVLFQNDSINSNYLIVENHDTAVIIILTIIIMTIILMFIFCLCFKKTLKEYFLPFFFASVFISLGSVLYVIFPMVNYSFDITETQVVEVTVINHVKEENLKGSFFDVHHIYAIDAPDNIPLNQISVDSDYKIDVNTRVFIKYRKGVFCNAYKVDYSRLTLAES